MGIDEPTPWCLGMVVISKSNSPVCICMDLKVLNDERNIPNFSCLTKLDVKSVLGKYHFHENQGF